VLSIFIDFKHNVFYGGVITFPFAGTLFAQSEPEPMPAAYGKFFRSI